MKLAITVAFAAVALAAGLDTVKSEPNLEKRSKMALDYANSEIGAARQAYASGKTKESTEALAEVRGAVDLCLQSLDETHKDARKSPKAFKRAELDIREMIRRLKSLEDDFSVDDRAEVVKTAQKLEEVHDDLVTRIMDKRK